MKAINREDRVEDFYRSVDNVGHRLADPLSRSRIVHALNLIREEVAELEGEIIRINTKHAYHKPVPRELIWELIKELADVQYVVSGFAVMFGIDLEEAFRIVHRSNMTKLDTDSRLPHEVDPDTGKIKKGPFYEPADVSGVIYAGKADQDREAV